MTKSTIAGRVCGAILFGLLAGVLPLESKGQIIFRNIDPRKMEVIPLTKPAEPSLPYLPKPELEQEDILPDRIQFTPIPKDNIVQENLRQNRLMTDWMSKDTIVQQSIAPPWFRHDIIGPERAEPEALPPRGSFRYQSPIFLPAVKPQPGLDDSMLLTPTPFSDRPIDARQGRSSTNKAPPPGGRAQPEQAGPRSLGW